MARSRYQTELGEAPPPEVIRGQRESYRRQQARDAESDERESKRARARRAASKPSDIGEAPPAKSAAPRPSGEDAPRAKQKPEPPKVRLTERAKAILATGLPERERLAQAKRLREEGPSLKTKPDIGTGKERLATAERRAELAGPQFKEIAKSPIPWLDFRETWDSLEGKGVEKGAYLAGEIGATILYLTMAGGVVRSAVLARPAKATAGTFGRVQVPKGSKFTTEVPGFPRTPLQTVKIKTTGVRPLTRAELKQQLDKIGAKKHQPSYAQPTLKPTAKTQEFLGGKVEKQALKDTALFSKKHPTPRDTIYIVTEGPASKLEVRAARMRVNLMGDRPPPGTKLDGPKITPQMPKGGGAKPAPVSPSTMTAAQMAKQLGIDPVTMGRPVVLPIPIPRRAPDPGEAPGPVTLPVPKPTPRRAPTPAPTHPSRPSPAPPPKPRPVTKPEKKPEKVPGPVPTPEPVPEKAPGPGPGPSPGPGPGPGPTPQPAPQPVPQPVPDVPPPPLGKKPPPKPPLAPKETTGKPRLRLLIPPRTDAPDKEKREYIQSVQGFVARRRGALRGKSVWRINYYPYGKGDELVIIGPAPKGAKLATGKGSVSRSATLLKGVPPKKPIYSDTGAIDDVIIARGRQIIIRSVQDKNIATRHALER